MMINIAGNPFRSIIGFKDAAGRTHAFLVKDFAEQSEHVELVTHAQGVVAYVHGATAQPFTGFAEYAPQHDTACDPIGQGCIGGCAHFASI